MKFKIPALCALTGLFAFASCVHAQDVESWYTESPWKQQDRPFLFYPDPADAKPKVVPKAKPKTF